MTEAWRWERMPISLREGVLRDEVANNIDENTTTEELQTGRYTG